MKFWKRLKQQWKDWLFDRKNKLVVQGPDAQGYFNARYEGDKTWVSNTSRWGAINIARARCKHKKDNVSRWS